MLSPKTPNINMRATTVNPDSLYYNRDKATKSTIDNTSVDVDKFQDQISELETASKMDEILTRTDKRYTMNDYHYQNLTEL